MLGATLHLFLPILALASTLVEYERQCDICPNGIGGSLRHEIRLFQQVLQEPPSTLGFPSTGLAVPGVAYRSDTVCSTTEYYLPGGGSGSLFPLHFLKQGLLTNWGCSGR